MFQDNLAVIPPLSQDKAIKISYIQLVQFSQNTNCVQDNFSEMEYCAFAEQWNIGTWIY